jgi:hypothetical protein
MFVEEYSDNKKKRGVRISDKQTRLVGLCERENFVSITNLSSTCLLPTVFLQTMARATYNTSSDIFSTTEDSRKQSEILNGVGLLGVPS